MAGAAGVAGMGLVVQARSREGVCAPGRLAAAPLRAEARAHGHARLAGLIGSHCGVRLSGRKRCVVNTALYTPNIMHSFTVSFVLLQHHAFSCANREMTRADHGNDHWLWKEH